MSRVQSLFRQVATQTTISIPITPTTHPPPPSPSPRVSALKLLDFPSAVTSTSSRRTSLPLNSAPFQVFSCSAITNNTLLKKDFQVRTTDIRRNIHHWMKKCSCGFTPSRCQCQSREVTTSATNVHGVVSVNSSSELPLLSSRGTSCETLTAHTNVIHARSVVTSPKVAEIGRGRMDDGKLLSKEEREEFMSMFPQLIRDLTEIPEYRDMDDTNRWLARVMHYNVPHGKRNRGLATALAYRYLAKELTDENVKLSYVLGWCVEILQAYFLVADDIMDESQTRRGRPCWYKVDDLGDNAFNDAILLESNLYMLLKKYFRNKDYYADLVDVMHDVNHKTIYGQSLDTRTGMEKKLETYTMDRYAAIVKYKTCFYSFYLPVRLGMAMVGMNDPDVLQQVRTVTLEMGHFFQVQDDYLDCFGDPAVTGKIGTDIQDSKCSWLFVVASQKCTPEQKKYLWENYGQNDPEKIARVKKLYIELEMPQTFSLYEEQTYNLICTHIRQMSEKLPKQLFYDMVNKIYKRSV